MSKFRETSCKHFRGMREECCLAGVNLRKHVGGPDYGWGARLPCIPDSGVTRADEVVPCELYALRTPEEVEAEEREIAELFGRTDKARQAIVDHLGGPWKRGMESSRGGIDCPICGTGRLHFSRAGYNGHIHAGCTTEDCVRWIE